MPTRRGPRDDTMEYTDRTRTQHRFLRDYLTSDVHGTLVVLAAAAVVIGLGIFLLTLIA